jgi:hypothetical protein
MLDIDSVFSCHYRFSLVWGNRKSAAAAAWTQWWWWTSRSSQLNKHVFIRVLSTPFSCHFCSVVPILTHFFTFSLFLTVNTQFYWLQLPTWDPLLLVFSPKLLISSTAPHFSPQPNIVRRIRSFWKHTTPTTHIQLSLQLSTGVSNYCIISTACSNNASRRVMNWTYVHFVTHHGPLWTSTKWGLK